MPPPQSRALLFRLLQADTPSPAEVAGLVRGFAAQQELEGQWFDAKSGALLQNKQGDELRAAVCGFANAEGGFLLIGYNEHARTFDHVAPVGKQQPEQWVSDSLGPIAHAIPPPHFATVEVEGGPVLLVAIERARSIVYVIEDGAPIYYLRFGHQTKPMPPSLVTDLMLGRKARPELRVTEVSPSSIERIRYPDTVRSWQLIVVLRVRYENEALVLADHARPGLVGWTPGSERVLPQQLLRSVSFETPPEDTAYGGYPWGGWGVVHRTCQPADLEPFAPGEGILTRWAIPAFKRFDARKPADAAQARGAVELKAALYLFARNADPLWWQLTVRYDEEAESQLTQHSTRHIRFEPCFYSRPVVSLRFLELREPVALEP